MLDTAFAAGFWSQLHVCFVLLCSAPVKQMLQNFLEHFVPTFIFALVILIVVVISS